jgi:hypothetical protein
LKGIAALSVGALVIVVEQNPVSIKMTRSHSLREIATGALSLVPSAVVSSKMRLTINLVKGLETGQIE